MATDPQSKALPPCPFLPPARATMSWRDLQADLFSNAPVYAQFLWQQHKPAQAILAICRALYLPTSAIAASCHTQSAPQSTATTNELIALYRAIGWIIRHHAPGDFLGNPRISFAHQASRMAAYKHLPRCRAWAVWYLVRSTAPDLPADPKSPESPPSAAALCDALNHTGLPGEGTAWLQLLTEKH